MIFYQFKEQFLGTVTLKILYNQRKNSLKLMMKSLEKILMSYPDGQIISW